MSLFSAATGWALFVAVVVTVGAVFSRWLVTTSPEHRRTAARPARLAAIFLPTIMVFVLARQVWEFRDPYASLSSDLGLVLGSAWGTAWLWAVIASVVAAVGFMAAASGRDWGWLLATPAVVALAVFPGLTGHAAAVEGPWRLPTLAADVLHVLAAGAWMGGLTAVLAVERAALRAPGDGRSTLPTLVPRFSRLAMVSVGVLALTGLFASVRHLPDWSSLWQTGYGRWLLLKLAGVGAVLLLGALNFKVLSPRLTDEEGPAAMRRAATLELLAGTVVLLVTAVLVRTSPLGH